MVEVARSATSNTNSTADASVQNCVWWCVECVGWGAMCDVKRGVSAASESQVRNHLLV